MAKSTHAYSPAQSEQPTQHLHDFLRNDALAWLNTGAEAFSELAELLRAIEDLSDGRASRLASIGVRVAEDCANSIDVCANTLQTAYLDNANKDGGDHE